MPRRKQKAESSAYDTIKIDYEKTEKYRQMTIKDVIDQFDEKNYTVKSLFAGAGGLDCGFRQAGLNVVESYEFESNACATLANAGEGAVYKCDISRLLLENQLRTMIITATFPCTHFSPAGLRDGDELYLEAHRIIRCLEPELFVIENVPAMQKYDIVMEAFMKMPHYHVSSFIINAAASEAFAAIPGYYIRQLVLRDAPSCGYPMKKRKSFIVGTKRDFDIRWNKKPAQNLRSFLEKRRRLRRTPGLCGKPYERSDKRTPFCGH